MLNGGDPYPFNLISLRVDVNPTYEPVGLDNFRTVIENAHVFMKSRNVFKTLPING